MASITVTPFDVFSVHDVQLMLEMIPRIVVVGPAGVRRSHSRRVGLRNAGCQDHAQRRGDIPGAHLLLVMAISFVAASF